MTIAERIALLSACASMLAVFVSAVGVTFAILNRSTLKEVHKTTNGLAQRAEAYAHEAGKAEGVKQEQDNPTK